MRARSARRAQPSSPRAARTLYQSVRLNSTVSDLVAAHDVDHRIAAPGTGVHFHVGRGDHQLHERLFRSLREFYMQRLQQNDQREQTLTIQFAGATNGSL